MSFYSNAKEVCERYWSYVEQFQELFIRYAVVFRRPPDFLRLVPKIESDERLSMDFAMLTRWIQQQEQGRLTVDEMLSIVGIALTGSQYEKLKDESVVPLMEFLTELGGWGSSPTAVEADRMSAPSADLPVSAAMPEAEGDFIAGADEEREVRELEMLLSGALQRNRGESGAPIYIDPEPLKQALRRLEEIAEAQRSLAQNASQLDSEIPRLSEEATPPVEQSEALAEDLTAQMQSPTMPEEEEAKPEEPPPERGVWRSASLADAAQRVPEEDIFRSKSFKAAHPEPPPAPKKRVQLKPQPQPAWMMKLAKLLGVPAIESKQMRVVVASFWFLVLIPPSVVCVLLYRDSVRTVSESPLAPFAKAAPAEANAATEVAKQARATEVEVARRGGASGQPVAAATKRAESLAVDDLAQERSSVEADAGNKLTALLESTGQSQMGIRQFDEAPVEQTEPARIHALPSGSAPTIAALTIAAMGAGELAAMPGSSLSVLRDTDPIQISMLSPDAFPVLDTGPGKIEAGPHEGEPIVATTRMTEPPSNVVASVEMSYPVVRVREASAVPVAAMSAATGTVAGAGSGAGNAPATAAGGPGAKGVSAAKPFELLHPVVAVSAGLLSSNIVKFQMPEYPKVARKQNLQGDVLVRIVISDKGKIEKAAALNGPPYLRSSVEKAVRHWRYTPYMENGQPVEVQTWVTFHFVMRAS
jgi:periplasmic protein TonB